MGDVQEFEHDLLTKYSTFKYREGFVRVAPTGTMLPKYYKNYVKQIRDFKVRDDDVWVISYPKTGTTWTQEMVWLLCNGLDYEGAKKPLGERFPFMESCVLFDFPKMFDDAPELASTPFVSLDSMKFVDDLPSPRFIKSHLPWELLPKELHEKKPKIVYVARNPKDVCVSFYHHNRLITGFTGTLDQFTQIFIDDAIDYSPFFTHVSEFYKHRDEQNILFLWYEDMKKNILKEAIKTADFLGHPLKDKDGPRLAQHLGIENMKKNAAVSAGDFPALLNQSGVPNDPSGRFVRNGQVGSWKNEMTPESVAKLDAWIEKGIKETGLPL